MKFDIIGDIHSCFSEFCDLLDKLEYKWDPRTCVYVPPKGRILVSVGDIIDRGQYPIQTYGLVRNMVYAGHMLLVRGNHDDKLMRWSKGNRVKLNNGLKETTERLMHVGIPLKTIYKFFLETPFYLWLDDKKLVVVHAAWRPSMGRRNNSARKNRSWALYGPTTGETLPNGMPDRIDWVKDREVKEDSPTIIYGHYPDKEIREENKTIGIDTGCVFGGKLSCIRYPEMEVVQVDALQVYATSPGWQHAEQETETR